MTYDRLQIRRGTASQWTSVNPTLLSGELGVETDTGKLKVGDGSTAWASRNYAGGSTNASDLVSGTLNDARLSANVQRTLARTDLGTFRSFGPLVMREGTSPRGPNGLTTQQAETYLDAWGFTSSAVTINGSGTAGTYYDNTCQFGFNVHHTVYNESSIRLTFESQFANSGNTTDMAMEWHIDGDTVDGTYFRALTGTVPKYTWSNLDNTLAIEAKTQRFTFTNAAGSTLVQIDARNALKRLQIYSGTTIDLQGLTTNRKHLRQLIDTNTDLWAFLPYADYTNSEITIASDYPLTVNGRLIATQRLSGNEIRLNDLNYQTVAKSDSSGGWIGGYNATVSQGGSLVHAANGSANAIYFGTGAIRFYSLTSQSAGSSLGAWGLEVSPTSNNDETYVRLWHNGQGNWMRVKIGASGTGPGGQGRMLYID